MSMTVTAGATDVTVPVYFVDDDGGTAPGEPTTGLLFSNIETGGSASYQRQGAARVDFALVTVAVAAAHTDGGFILVDDTNMPGLYRLDVPDLAFATGADFVIIMCVAAAANNSIMRPLLVALTAFDLQNAIPTVNVVEFVGETVPAPAATGVPDVNVTHQGDGAIPAPAATGVPDVNVTHYIDGVVPAQGVTGVPDVNVTHQVDTVVPAPNTAGIPDVNVVENLDVAVVLSNGLPDVNVENWLGTIVTAALAGRPDVNTAAFLNTAVVLSNGLPDVNVENWLGAIVAAATAGVPNTNPVRWNNGLIPAQGITGVPEVDVTHTVAGLVPTPNNTGIPDVNVQEMLDVAITLTGNDLDVHVAAILSAAADTIARKVLPQINTAFNDIQILMVDDTDHVTPETGLSLTVTRAINSGSFGAATGTVTEMALGMYQFDASAADMNGAVITFRFVGTGADDTFVTIRTAA